jgi:hypothetical protein
MEWRQVYRTEHEVKMDDYVNGVLGVPAIGLVGKHIRVMIEEAVDELSTVPVWRETLRYGGQEARRIHDAAFPHAPLEPGRNIRIRIEEEVYECCEKWRGADVWRMSTSYSGTSTSKSVSDPIHPTFCPECGSKL